MLDAAALVAQTRQHICEVDVTTLAHILPSKPLIIDIREPNEWSEGLIPGANTIPRGVLEMQVLNLPSLATQTNKTSLPIYLYCRSGGRSALAAKSLMQMGLTVYSLAGGIQAWQAKYPLSNKTGSSDVNEKGLCAQGSGI